LTVVDELVELVLNPNGKATQCTQVIFSSRELNSSECTRCGESVQYWAPKNAASAHNGKELIISSNNHTEPHFVFYKTRGQNTKKTTFWK